MFRRRKPRVGFPRYPPRWPNALLWGLPLAATLAGLVAFAFLLAQPPPSDTAWPWDELVATVRSPGVAIALAVLALTALAACFRHVWLEWLAVRPGGIQVETFTADSELGEADLERWTLRFRQRFAELHLNAPASVPGALADGDFLDVLGGSGVDSRNWLGSALSLIRAAKPSHAWRVTGVLVRREQRPRYGLTVQVLRLPDAGTPPETVWGSTWDEAVRHGADRVTAAILPRTRRCKKQWAAWRRYRMPGTLLEAYEDAAEFESERRYDEALDAYYRAARQDPMNMPLRLRIGQLQEKLGLYLDALATYEGLQVVGEERTPRARSRDGRAARRERRQALVAASYRRIVLLGGSELAEQWRKTTTLHEDESLRERRRRMVRERLRSQLEVQLEETVRRHRPLPFGTPIRWREVFLEARRRPRRGDWSAIAALAEPRRLPAEEKETEVAKRYERRALLELRELFALTALRDLRRLLRHLRPHPLERILLSPQSAQLTARCIEVRLDWIQYILTDKQSKSWPPEPRRLHDQIRAIEGRRGFDLWHEHYNAACVYALPLMARDVRTEPSRADKLAKCAVVRLARATAHAESAYVAGRRDWLLSEDPDLDGLRAHARFKDFEAMNFPAAEPTAFRPLAVKTLESSRYVQALLTETARCWEQAWHERGRHLQPCPEVHQLLDWWNDEREAWELVREVALNNRHWPARVALLHALRDRADSYGFVAPVVMFPRYADRVLTEKELGEGEEERRRAAERIATETEKHLHEIGATVCRHLAMLPESGEMPRIASWQEELRRLDTRGREPRRFLLALLCDDHAALWQLLREWIAADPGGDQDENHDAFCKQMAHTARVWCGAGEWWRSVALVRAAAHRGARPALLFGRYAGNGGKTSPVAGRRAYT
jgi:hypothetical protein